MADLNEKVTPIIQNGGRSVAADLVSRTSGSLNGWKDVNVGSTERLISVAGGVLLFGWGIYRRGVLGYGAMMTAAALWDRGVRGHCGLYAALGKTSAEPAIGTNGTLSSPTLP